MAGLSEVFGGKTMPGKFPSSATVEVVQEEADAVARLLIMLMIFVVSLVAVSFPTITETYRSVRVPSIFFFVGKHFGTGVILSTAFVHLLQDAFKALQDPDVNARWKVGQWSGMIVLGSLLAIFLVEYVSTAFVDRLHSYSSAPSSPTISACSSPSPAPSLQMDYEAAAEIPASARPSILVQSPHGTKSWAASNPAPHHHKQPGTTANVHPVGEFDESEHPSAAPLPLAPPELADEAEENHHYHRISPTTENTPLNTSDLPSPMPDRNYGTTRSSVRPHARPNARNAHISAPPDDAFFSGGHHRHETRDSHSKHHAPVSRWSWFGFPWTHTDDASPLEPSTIARLASTHSLRSGYQSSSRSHRAHTNASHSVAHRHGPERGLSRHSHAHSHSHGHEHGHGHGHLDMEQWMEGMDGGARDDPNDEECGSDSGDEEMKIGRRRQVIGILVLQMGIMIHSLVIGLTLSITSGSEFTSLVIAIVFHQLFEGLSLGIRIAGLPSKHSEDGFKHISGRTLKPILAFTFAITTPLGIALGLAALGGATSTGPRLTLVQGVMSAISAGMLIYAACVEMLAGDFVMDAHLWRSSVRRQVLALVSLFAGVAAMAAIGFLD
ncbi:Zinc/iron permease [Trametes elegans]|nr:Zinc/iron permease [Trametes elegans]